MKNHPAAATPVWDLPTRIFHWSLVVLVGLNLFLVEPRGGTATVIHMVAGYLIAGLLLFRLAWGVIGSPRSRFADFVRGWPAVRDYLGRLRRLSPPHSVGHNPLGGWMIVILLAALVVMVATGLTGSGRAAMGPLAPLLPVGVTATMGELHELVGNLLIGLIAIHILGVIAEWLMTGQKLVSAMVHGRKHLSHELAALERPLAHLARAVLVGIVALAFVLWLVATSDFGANRRTLAESQGVTLPPPPSQMQQQ
ncbi:MAG: cytochrome b/b6 domain-containing protein [Dongiaceae bacterium]